jgi:hypothetical protein
MVFVCVLRLRRIRADAEQPFDGLVILIYPLTQKDAGHHGNREKPCASRVKTDHCTRRWWA